MATIDEVAARQTQVEADQTDLRQRITAAQAATAGLAQENGALAVQISDLRQDVDALLAGGGTGGGGGGVGTGGVVAVGPGEVFIEDFDDGSGDWDKAYRAFHAEWFGKPIVLRWGRRKYEFNEKNFDNSILQMWQRCQWIGAHPNDTQININSSAAAHGIGFANANKDQFIANTAIYRCRIGGGGLDGDGIHCDHALGELDFLLNTCFMGGFRGDNVWIGNMTADRKAFLGYEKNAGHRASTPARILGPGCSLFGSRSAVNIDATAQTGVTIHANSGDNMDAGVYRLPMKNCVTTFVGAGKSEHSVTPVPIFDIYETGSGHVHLGGHTVLIRTPGCTLINVTGNRADLDRIDWHGFEVRTDGGTSMADIRGLVLNGEEIVSAADLIGRSRRSLGDI